MKGFLPRAVALVAILALAIGFAGRQTEVSAAVGVPVFINELHYDDSTAAGDTGEAIEIAGPAGTNLSGWSLVLYNGSGGAVYDTRTLSGTIPNQQSNCGTLSFSYPTNGI